MDTLLKTCGNIFILIFRGYVMPTLKDNDIRIPLIQKLNLQNEGHDYRIIPEMAICDGLSRVDIAVANGKLCGYEIKSDADTLERLESQQKYYNKTFDKVYIVVGQKYENIIQNHIPDWWGVYIAYYDKKDNIQFKQKKRGRQNKMICADSLLELLWKNELVSLLRSYDYKGISGKNRRILRQIACENLSLEIIKEYTRETLKKREEWR